MANKNKLAFIGCGKMAEALIGGILKGKAFTAKNIIVFDVDPKRLQAAKKRFGVTVARNNQQAVDLAQTVILAVKPQGMKNALNGIKAKNKLVISIAAGVKLAFFGELLPESRIIRAMPNNPALVAKGVTALAPSRQCREADTRLARRLFSCVGEVVDVPEKLMDAVTGLSGSGPAFVYLFIEAMIEAGVLLGLDGKKAEKLATATVLGSAETIRATRLSPRALRKMVTSPGGTTLEGIKALEGKEFRQIVIGSVVAAARRSRELSEQ
ncbi:MAG: pyrroline-5-carboxylate reductase [Candidatus Margulisiibacteriota bacterium]